MTEAKHVDECRDVYDFLDQVRLRPGMFVRSGSLLELQSMLYGFRVASAIYGPQPVLDFEHEGPFTKWLWPRLGRTHSSPLGWAIEITKAAQAANRAGIDLFFDLLDEFKAERGPQAR
ncbi:hypothetical protein ACFQ8W_21170 [Streptomyces sp. NPDC056508]|uniref:hypothetical protein n=1 Tax=Streptomyces sp. NPDC056508 TaxID=3345845 RepID=UPI00369B0F0D